MIAVQELAAVPALQEVPQGELAWLASQLRERDLTAGEVYYTQGEPVTGLQIVLSGTLQGVRREAGQEVNSFVFEPGEISGLLPFSRMRVQGVTAVALQNSRVAELSAEVFPQLGTQAPTLLQILVHEMLDRTQEYTRLGAQREKLISLGTMSAGLAHELNNPASAAKRAAGRLQETLQAFDEHSAQILVPFIFGKREEGTDPFAPLYAAMTLDGDRLSTLERGDREDELGEWLQEQGLEDAWEVAPVLVAGGLSRDVMKGVAHALVPGQVTNFLRWVPRDVEMRLLARELMESTTRISDLVGAMKAYTYMDQGQGKQEVDLREGLLSTLVILRHKWRQKGVQIVKHFGEVPPVPAYGSELNQVWTNLLSNAIDAVAPGGTVTIEVGHDTASAVACVDIIDDGPGVPPELQGRIFEPFFTTKPVGEGTGMGLDIAGRIVRQRHLGSLQLNSRPGWTRFRVRLPLGEGHAAG